MEFPWFLGTTPPKEKLPFLADGAARAPFRRLASEKPFSFGEPAADHLLLTDQGLHFADRLDKSNHDRAGDDAVADIEFFEALEAGDRLYIGIC